MPKPATQPSAPLAPQPEAQVHVEAVSHMVVQPHTAARAYALEAAKVCESPALTEASRKSAVRMLRAAIALLDG